jgi:hypothetical protein
MRDQRDELKDMVLIDIAEVSIAWGCLSDVPDGGEGKGEQHGEERDREAGLNEGSSAHVR